MYICQHLTKSFFKSYSIIYILPTGNLDSATGHDVIGLLKTAAKEFRQTLVLITHDNDIAQTADRIVRIEDGKILQREGQ